MGIYQKLLQIQTELKAPKSQYNNFGKYSYRSCEDILEALKPILARANATVVISDEIVNIANRFYIKATAKIIDTETGEQIEAAAFAREEESKKGMDGSQVTGSSSSYARKYALNGLFAIDDTKNSDYSNNQNEPKEAPKPPRKPSVNQNQTNKAAVLSPEVSDMMNKGICNLKNKFGIKIEQILKDIEATTGIKKADISDFNAPKVFNAIGRLEQKYKSENNQVSNY
ncbi:MAG: ERF family protein [Clostridia bacterium]|nr:ERF family protein [Clostridia bacterium]